MKQNVKPLTFSWVEDKGKGLLESSDCDASNSTKVIPRLIIITNSIVLDVFVIGKNHLG